jgi:carbamoyl-phosphate synthase large subunit
MTSGAYGGELLATDLSATAPAFHDADRSFLVPHCTSEDYIPHMLELCEREGVGLLIPLIDTELMMYARHRADFAAIDTRVMVSSPAAIAITADKIETHLWLVAQGFPTVRQATPESVLAQPQEWPWPLIAKPVGGSCSIGVERVADPEALAQASAHEPYIVQETASGFEYTVSVYIDEGGRALCAVPRLRLEVRAGEVSKAVAQRVPSVEGLALELAERLPDAVGAINVQIFHDPVTDECRVIEMNLRFGGGFPLAWAVGARYPEWLLRERRGETLSFGRDCWSPGVSMLRFDDSVLVPTSSLGVSLPGAEAS